MEVVLNGATLPTRATQPADSSVLLGQRFENARAACFGLVSARERRAGVRGEVDIT